MVSPSLKAPELITGMRLELDEFIARWEALPDLKFAELIDGIVFVPPPRSIEHGQRASILNWWLFLYVEDKRGCDALSNVTCTMLGQSPQPDVLLRLTEEFGGKSIDKGYLLDGAPELVVDICETSTEIEFGPKLALYQRAGVREYITIQTLPPPRIVWRVLVDGSYREIQPDGQGILRSQCFPGLWLDTEALWAGDRKRMRDTLNAGLDSPAHREFAERLTKRRIGA